MSSPIQKINIFYHIKKVWMANRLALYKVIFLGLEKTLMPGKAERSVVNSVGESSKIVTYQKNLSAVHDEPDSKTLFCAVSIVLSQDGQKNMKRSLERRITAITS